MLGVTLFGVLLTPVFFYVIAWIGEMRLLSAGGSRWIGSALAGGLLGSIAGFLLAKLGVGRLLVMPLAGAGLGIVAGLLIPAIGQRIRPRPVAPAHEATDTPNRGSAL
jgi:hypothetical protein